MLTKIEKETRLDINTQPWLLWFRDMPEHSTIQRGKVDGNSTDDVSSADDYTVKVGRPELSDPHQIVFGRSGFLIVNRIIFYFFISWLTLSFYLCILYIYRY